MLPASLVRRVVLLTDQIRGVATAADIRADAALADALSAIVGGTLAVSGLIDLLSRLEDIV